jgi:PAS domain-containing protein
MAEKRTIELEIQDNSKSLKSQYKEAVQELQKVSAQYGETSQQAVKAAKAAAELKDQIGFSKDLVDSFNPDAKFNSLSKSVGGVLDGFQAFEGALGLIGVESEALQETMLRVQSAMALSQGIQGLMEAKDSFKQLGAVAMNALKGIRGALAATGIGLFVVALGTVVAYWDDIKEAVSGVSEEQAKLNELSHTNFETSKEELSTLDAQDNILKLQGKSEREILNLKIAKVNAAIELGKIELENVIRTSKAEEEAAIKNYNLTKSIVNLIIDTALFLPKLMIKPIDLAIQGANKVSEALGLGKLISFDLGKTIEDLEDKAAGFVAGSLFNVEDVKAEGEKTRKGIEKELKDLENQKAGFQLSIKEIDKKAVEDSKKQREDALSEEERKQKEHQEKYANIEKLKTKSVLDASNERINKEKQETEFQKQQNQLKVQANQEYLDKIKAQEEAANALKKRNKDFAIEMTLSGLSTIASLTELFGKKSEKQAKRAFQVQKAAQVASALINTYQSATGAYASQFLPVPDPTSPVRGGIAAGLAVAAGLVNVAKIASQKFEGGSQGGGGAPGGGGGGGAQMAAPQFNTIGSSGINQLATLQQQPVQAYVVSGEVTSAQSLDRNRVQNATL